MQQEPILLTVGDQTWEIAIFDDPEPRVSLKQLYHAWSAEYEIHVGRHRKRLRRDEPVVCGVAIAIPL